ncbi:unnamed protein product [Vicia faba]|uniref:Uncharacterized protein n=1 Tax=Vicia faba TaxID=3906 RepID=A0AAV1BCV8_VICFA|nr:unnamed protein product [Vicia faba]
MMRKDLKFLYQGIGYKEGFSSGEVSSFLHRKKCIHTRAIVFAITSAQGVKLVPLDAYHTYHIYQATFLFSLVVAGQSDVLVMGNPSMDKLDG